MFFSIDPHNGVAIYEQIVRQIKFGIAEGILKSGQMVPSVRMLSQQLTINPNTINRAFQTLQQEGVLASVRGQGLVVLEDARPRCIADRKTIVSDRLQSALTEAIHSGLSAEQIESLVKNHLKALTKRNGVPTVASAVPQE